MPPTLQLIIFHNKITIKLGMEQLESKNGNTQKGYHTSTSYPAACRTAVPTQAFPPHTVHSQSFHTRAPGHCLAMSETCRPRNAPRSLDTEHCLPELFLGDGRLHQAVGPTSANQLWEG